jgi:hypothetical protein
VNEAAIERHALTSIAIAVLEGNYELRGSIRYDKDEN